MESDQSQKFSSKRKYEENDSNSNEKLDLGHLNHTFDDSDYSTDCSTCMRKQEHKKFKSSKDESYDEHEENDRSVADNIENPACCGDKVNLLIVFLKTK